jgi:hypothetical protein
VPANAVFADSGNGIGGFEFTPEIAQGGSAFLVRFIASDGTAADTVEVTYSILSYMIGDCDANGSISPLDVIILMNYIYRQGAAPVPSVMVGDLTCDGTITPIDLTVLVNYVYRQGPLPPVSCP